MNFDAATWVMIFFIFIFALVVIFIMVGLVIQGVNESNLFGEKNEHTECKQ